MDPLSKPAWKRAGGGWHILHEHVSVDVPPPSGEWGGVGGLDARALGGRRVSSTSLEPSRRLDAAADRRVARPASRSVLDDVRREDLAELRPPRAVERRAVEDS